MKQLCVIVAVPCSACAHSSPGPPTTEQVAIRSDLPYAGPGEYRVGCMPTADDSTRFSVDIVVDYLQETGAAALDLVRDERAAPRLGYVYQAVSVELQLAG